MIAPFLLFRTGRPISIDVVIEIDTDLSLSIGKPINYDRKNQLMISESSLSYHNPFFRV